MSNPSGNFADQKLSQAGNWLASNFSVRQMMSDIPKGSFPMEKRIWALIAGVMVVGICIEAKQHCTWDYLLW